MEFDDDEDVTLAISSPLEDETAQRLAIKYQTFLGEWFLDTRIGIPFFRDVLVKNPDLAIIRELFLEVAQDDPAIAEIRTFELDIGDPPRSLSISIAAILIDGTGADLEFTPFIVGA